MKKWLSVFTGGLLCATIYSSSSLYAMLLEELPKDNASFRNHKFPPERIFCKREDGQVVTLPQFTTGAHALQKEGINGKGLVAAIIDYDMFPGHIMDNGVIHPEAISQGFIWAPDDKLALIVSKIQDLKAKFNKEFEEAQKGYGTKGRSPAEREASNRRLFESINEERGLYRQAELYKEQFPQFYTNEFFLNLSASTHGSGVMDALHLIAPGATLVPIDYKKLHMNMKLSYSEAYAYAIREAIKFKPDVINICVDFSGNAPEITKACQEAVDAGIAIIIAAGNASSKETPLPYFVDEYTGKDSKFYCTSMKLGIAEQLKGKGICFAGAVRYSSEEGEEKTTTYTSYPGDSELCVFMAGSKPPVRSFIDSNTLGKGTYHSAPVLAGAFLLLKQVYLSLKKEAIEQGYQITADDELTADDLLTILHASGRDILSRRKDFPKGKYIANLEYLHLNLTQGKNYKSLYLENAKRMLAERFKLFSKKH